MTMDEAGLDERERDLVAFPANFFYDDLELIRRLFASSA